MTPQIWYVAFGSNTVPALLGRYLPVELSPDHDVALLEQHLQAAIERSHPSGFTSRSDR